VSGSSDDLTFALSLEVEKLENPIPDTLTVVAPNGGETFLSGQVASIRWSHTGSMASVDLAYSTDAGGTWTPIAFGVAAGAGLYAWTVPSVSTTQGLVRVSRVGGELSDVSDAPFTINHEQHVQAIAFGSEWKYWDSGLDPGTAWNTPGFYDSGWSSGAGQLGYGDGDETTVISRTTPSQTSVYFRKKITLSGHVTSATLSALVDDGVVIYVNGTQVFSRHINNPAHNKYASASVENLQESASLALSPNPFVLGENTIAVMVKQVGATSPDLSFDLALEVVIMAGEH
jgi:galactose oxidase